MSTEYRPLTGSADRRQLSRDGDNFALANGASGQPPENVECLQRGFWSEDVVQAKERLWGPPEFGIEPLEMVDRELGAVVLDLDAKARVTKLGQVLIEG